MEFYNLIRELEKLSACSNLELEVALDAMIALITDLRNIHHVKFFEGSFGNPSALNTKLSRLANELIRVYDAKKDSFQQIPRDYFPPDIRKIERELLEVQNRLLDQEEQLKKADSAKTQLEEKLAQEQKNLKALQDKQARIQSLTVTLDAAIAQAKDIDLPGLEARKAALEQENAQLKISLDAAAAEEADLSAQAAAATAKEQELNGKIDRHKQVLEKLANVGIEIIGAGEALTKAQDDLNAASDKLRRTNEEIASVEERTGALERDIAQQERQLRDAEDTRLARQHERDGLITKLAEAQTETQTLQTHSDDLTAQLERTNAAAEELRRSITQVNDDIEASKTAHEDLTAEFYALNKELDYQNSRNEAYRADPLKTTADELAAAKLTYDGLVAKHGDLTDQLKAVEEERKKVDRKISTAVTSLRINQDKLDESTRDLEDREAELQHKQDELDTLRERIARNADDVKDILQEIDEATEILNNWDPVGTKAKYESKRKELEERLAGVKAMRKKLEEDTAQLEALRTEAGEQHHRQAAIREEYRILSDDFSRLRDPKTKEEIDHFIASISVMKEVRRRIKDSTRYLPDAPDLPDEVRTALQADLDLVGKILETLRSGIDQYLEIYTRHTASAAEQF